MQNEILRKRVCRLIGMSYSLSEEETWTYYVRIGSLDLLLNLLETNKLNEFLRNINEKPKTL